jgi:hypothetical protein
MQPAAKKQKGHALVAHDKAGNAEGQQARIRANGPELAPRLQ